MFQIVFDGSPYAVFVDGRAKDIHLLEAAAVDVQDDVLKQHGLARIGRGDYHGPHW